MDSILMYSGGVDSLVCLSWLVENGYDPALIHVRHGRLTDAHERRIRRNARKLYHTDAYYVFSTELHQYLAGWENTSMNYWVRQTEEEIWNMHQWGLPVCVGYWWRDNPSQKAMLKEIRYYRPNKYLLPLADMKNEEILEMWLNLPEKVQNDTVSTSRLYFREYGGQVVDWDLEDGNFKEEYVWDK